VEEPGGDRSSEQLALLLREGKKKVREPTWAMVHTALMKIRSEGLSTKKLGGAGEESQRNFGRTAAKNSDAPLQLEEATLEGKRLVKGKLP